MEKYYSDIEEWTDDELQRAWDRFEKMTLDDDIEKRMNCIHDEIARRQDQARLSTGASPVKPDGSAGLSESRVTQTDPEKQLGLHDGINQKPK